MRIKIVAGGTFGGPPGATVKNFDTTGQYRQDGQTAQAIDSWQVGRPSKFFQSKLVCLIPIYVSGRPATKGPPSGERRIFCLIAYPVIPK